MKRNYFKVVSFDSPVLRSVTEQDVSDDLCRTVFSGGFVNHIAPGDIPEEFLIAKASGAIEIIKRNDWGRYGIVSTYVFVDEGELV